MAGMLRFGFCGSGHTGKLTIHTEKDSGCRIPPYSKKLRSLA